ncbi:uncharacterized protein [Nicotiana sylvestris]|uniref:uncharacterized protein n=1 Tax=Nicotiana sylvestris TaxID=4096 RepID=UPI00388C563A
MVQDALEKVKVIQDRLHIAHSRQKCYVDRKVRDVAFMVGKRVFLWVLPMKGDMRFRKKGKLSPSFICPFEVLWRVGEVDYELALPPILAGLHPVFHVLMLWRYQGDPSHVLDFSSVQLDKDLSYVEEPVVIVDRQVNNLGLIISSGMSSSSESVSVCYVVSLHVTAIGSSR